MNKGLIKQGKNKTVLRYSGLGTYPYLKTEKNTCARIIICGAKLRLRPHLSILILVRCQTNLSGELYCKVVLDFYSHFSWMQLSHFPWHLDACDNSPGADHFCIKPQSEWRCVSVEIITLVTSLHFLSNLYFREGISMQRDCNDLDKALAWVMKE